jgi:hypothetical protein
MRPAAAVPILLLSLCAAVGGCRKRSADAPQIHAADASGPAIDAGPQLDLRVEVGPQVLLPPAPGYDRLRLVPGGDFVGIHSSLRAIRRLTEDGQIVWERSIQGKDGLARPAMLIGDVAVVGSSVWVGLVWHTKIWFGSVTLERDRSLESHELLLIELDLATGNVLSHHRYPGNAGGTVTLAAHGDELYAAFLYADPDDGRPSWGPSVTPPRRGYRVVRFSTSGEVVWMVDGVTPDVTAYPLLDVSDCCVLLLEEARQDVSIGDEQIRIPASNIYRPWIAVLSRDGRVLDARMIHEEGFGTAALAVLEGDLVHYALSGAYDGDLKGMLEVTAPRSRATTRVPLECGGITCLLVHLQLVDAGVLVVVQSLPTVGKLPPTYIARIYDAHGAVRAETTFDAPATWQVRAFRRIDGGAQLYFYDGWTSMLRKITIMATEVGTDRRPRRRSASTRRTRRAGSRSSGRRRCSCACHTNPDRTCA